MSAADWVRRQLDEFQREVERRTDLISPGIYADRFQPGGLLRSGVEGDERTDQHEQQVEGEQQRQRPPAGQ